MVIWCFLGVFLKNGLQETVFLRSDRGATHGNRGLRKAAFATRENMQKCELYLPGALEIAASALPMPFAALN